MGILVRTGIRLKSDFTAQMRANRAVFERHAHFLQEVHKRVVSFGERWARVPLAATLSTLLAQLKAMPRPSRPVGIPDTLRSAFGEYESILRNLERRAQKAYDDLRSGRYVDVFAAADVVRIELQRAYGRAGALEKLLRRMYG